MCPESCGYCPDLLFGYEVIIINTDTNEEFNYNDNSLPAGNYLVRDSINCTIEEGFVIKSGRSRADWLGNCINDLVEMRYAIEVTITQFLTGKQ